MSKEDDGRLVISFACDGDLSKDLQMLAIFKTVLDKFMPDLNHSESTAALNYMQAVIKNNIDNLGD